MFEKVTLPRLFGVITRLEPLPDVVMVPLFVRFVGAVMVRLPTAKVPPSFIVRVLPAARVMSELKDTVFAVFSTVTLFRVSPPVLMACAMSPSNIMVPLLWTKLPLFVKSPPTLIAPEGAVRVVPLAILTEPSAFTVAEEMFISPLERVSVPPTDRIEGGKVKTLFTSVEHGAATGSMGLYLRIDIS